MGKTKRCPHCGKQFKIGYNGTIEGCDECQDVERDKYGYAWKKWETSQTYMSVETGKEETVTRMEAFGD